MEMTTLLGLVAGALTTTSFVPQVIKTWRLKQTEELSGYMFSMLVAGIALWLAYGILIGDIAIVVANGVSFVFGVIILYFKVKFG